MSEARLVLPDLTEDDGQAARQGISVVDCAREVIDAYTAIMRDAHNEQRAFEQAVRIYQARNPKLSSEAARRAVAIIICNKP